MKIGNKQKRKEETRPNQNMNYRTDEKAARQHQQQQRRRSCMKGIYITLQYYTTQPSPSHSPWID